MTLTKITQKEIDDNNVKSAPDTPTGSAINIKALFDKLTELIAGKHNSIVSELESTIDGSSGANNIGSTPLKTGGTTTVQGQLKELQGEKVDKVAGKGLSTNDFTNEDVNALANKVDKIAGKGLSEANFTDSEKNKLCNVAENANNYSLPIASVTALGGIKIGQGMEIRADGSVNATAAPAPDLPCRKDLAQEIIDRDVADTALKNRIVAEEQARATEEQTRATADSNLQTQITGNKQASNINISDTVRNLYGLTVDNANVDKALGKSMNGGLLNALLTGFVKTADTGDVIASDNLLKALNKLVNNSLKVILGSYTGDGQQKRYVEMGVQTRLVIIPGIQTYIKSTAFSIPTMNRNLVCMGSGCYVGTRDDYVVEPYRESSSYTNAQGVVYNYIVIGE